MKMKIRQWIGLFMAVCILHGLSWAQGPTTMFEGEKGKCYVLTGVAGLRSAFLSADGLFVGGESSQSNKGYVYDIARDSMKITTAAARVKSWTVYAGYNTINRDGQLIEIETNYTGNADYYKKVGVWAAAASFDTVVTMSYELAPNPVDPATQKVFNVPYLVDGKTGKIIRRVDPHWPLEAGNVDGYGARVDAASNDALILAGHSTKPGAFHNWSPVFWDVEHDTSFYLGDEEISGGNLTCVNNDGTIIAGRARGNLVVVHYDRENRTYEIENMPYAPGMGTGEVSGISETGLVVCIQQVKGSELGSRDAYVYNMNDKSLVRLEEYLKELYGLTMSIPVGTPLSISDDGRKITGWSLYGTSDAPYLIVLDENQIFAKPRSLNAYQPYGEMTVQLSWTAPLRGQYTLKGYNVFCDGEQINAEMLDKAETSFDHADVPQGVHVYTVKAVYEEGTSDDCDPMNMMVIAGDGCLPVQEIGHHLTYNRGVEIYWGLPSAKMSQPVEKAMAFSQPIETVAGGEASGRNVVSPKSYPNKQLDLVEYKMLDHYTFSSALVIDGRVYGAQYHSTSIKVFDMNDMSLLNVYQLQSLITNMAYANDALYLATDQEEIVVVNINTMTQSNTLKTKAGVKVRNIAYIPTLDGGKGGFAYGDWETLLFCDRYGRELTEGVPTVDIKGLLISGMAYHNGKLYLYSQTGKTRAEIYTVDMATGKLVGKRDLADIQRLMDIETGLGFIAGGMSVSTLRDGTVVLGCVMQFSAHNSHVAFIEIESAPKLLGFNLYRSKDGGNFEQVNPVGQYIEGLSYRENLMEAGAYVYKVEAVSEGDCRMMLDNVNTKLTIEPIGTCVPPVSVQAVERAKSVRLDWDYVKDTTGGPGLVGFNVYRNGELLVEHSIDHKYTDFNVAKGDYTYRVEAFYNNSCMASDSTPIKVTYEGVAMPPAHVALTHAETAGNPQHYDVAATWELPYFEQPLALGYCNIPYTGVTLKEAVPIYALIGWDSTQLEAYKNLYVVGIEYFIGEKVKTVEGRVYVNDTLAYAMPQPGRIREASWNTLMFDRYFPMDQPSEFLVGYKVTYEADAVSVAVFDYGPGKKGYGDLISGDGKTWITLASNRVDANWCINALVVDKRDLEEAAAASVTSASMAGGPAVQPVVKVMSLDASLALNEPQAVSTASAAAKSSSETVKLQGFNVYRNGDKVNESLLTSFAYTDAAVAAGEYDYEISAVYSGGEEVKSEATFVNLGDVANLPETLAESVRVFPNPARLYFRVEGEYTALEITDLSGKTLRRYTDGRSEIDATGLKAGLYVLRFTLADGTQRLQKIVLE